MALAPLVVTARAPGKLFWLGEYAVLFGGPAVVRAVDRYVSVTVRRLGRADQTTLQIAALGADLPPLSVALNPTLTCKDRRPAHDLVVTVLEALVAHGVLHAGLGAIECTIDSRALFLGDKKLGLGSSAAVTLALIRALADFAAEAVPERAVPVTDDLYFNVHRAFQKGRGSGADVAAGIVGGTCLFQRVSNHTLPLMRTIEVPETLHAAPVWAGKPASTSDALGALDRYQRRYPARFSEALTPLLELAGQGAVAIETGDSEGFVQICGLYSHNLSEFGRMVGIDIVSAAHRELVNIARASGVAYKPSGAGHGDFGIGFSMDIKALRYFERRAKHAGFTPLKLGCGEPCHRNWS